MNWSSEAPTEPGYYWHCHAGITTMECVITLDSLFVVDHYQLIPVDRYYDGRGKWYGPIPEPTADTPDIEHMAREFCRKRFERSTPPEERSSAFTAYCAGYRAAQPCKQDDDFPKIGCVQHDCERCAELVALLRDARPFIQRRSAPNLLARIDAAIKEPT